METTSKLSNIQIELLKLYQNDISDNDLLVIKNFLSNYFANKASDQFEDFIRDNNFTTDEVNSWSKEHLRTI
jgi:hypothetical protein